MKKIASILFIALTISCVKEHPINIPTISFNMDQEQVELQKTGIIKDYDVIKLEKKDESIIGIINQVVCHNGLIYVSDSKQTRSVFIFDANGKFLRKISRLGKASNEYLDIASIFIDEFDNTFNILTRTASKLLKFNIDGLGEPKIIRFEGVYLTDMQVTKDHYIGFAGNTSSSLGDDNILVFNREGKIVTQSVKIREGWESSLLDAKNFLAKSGNDIYYVSNIDQHIFMYQDNDEIHPIFTLDYGKYNWPAEIKTYDHYSNNRNADFIYNFNAYCKTSSHWLFYTLFHGQYVLLAYNIETKATEVCSIGVNMDKYFLSFGDLCSFDSKSIITSISAINMKTSFDGYNIHNDFREKYPEQIKRLQTRLGSVEEDGNPFLIIYQL